jgi:OFA family oxalate/formate antiporter-like MFS transporter
VDLTGHVFKARNSGFGHKQSYGWVVVGACFLCCVTYGTFYTFGIFFKPLQEEFGWSYTVTSSVQSVHLLIYIISSFFVGWMVDRYGPRLPLIICAFFLCVGFLLCSRITSIKGLYLSYSIASAGAGIVWSLPLSVVQRWFTKKRGLALGMTVSGIGIGTFVWALFANYFIYHYGWRNSYILMGMITGIVLLVSSLLIRVPEEKRPFSNAKFELSSRNARSSDSPALDGMDLAQALRTKKLWLICLFQFFFNVGIFFVFVHLVPFGIQIGIDKGIAAAGIAFMGGVSVLGRVLSPMFIERKMQSKWETGLIICSLVASLIMACFIYINSLPVFFISIIIFGYFYGSWIPLVVALTGRGFGLRNLGTVLGITQIGLIGGIVGPLMGGFIHDQTGSYTVAFIIAAVVFLLAGAAAFVIRLSGNTTEEEKCCVDFKAPQRES